jgi:uncharacterized protein (TIGR02266 family)
MYERQALILDGDGAPLSQLSLSLISLGLSPLYATDLDELVLLASEYREGVGGVLVAAEAIDAQLPELLERLVEPLGLSPAAVVPIGEPLPTEARDELAGRGLRWALWRPFETCDLRFVVAQVLSDTDPEEIRADERVPCEIPAQLECPLRAETVRLTDLSRGGCFASLRDPFPRGTRVALRCELDGRPFAVRGRVAWASGPDLPAWREPGMGIEFLELEDDARASLARTVEARIGRYRLARRRRG